MATVKKKDELDFQQNQTSQKTVPAQSNTVQQAQNTLQQLSGRNYQSQWQPQINTMMDQYLNRDKFSYDVNADALYQQLKDQYALMGQQAMMDTMGQASALTGGYGNSYAQGVGQQAYQGYMQQLNDKIPDLYQLALNRYMTEGSQMLDNMNLMMQQDSIDYGRYRDQMADQDDAYNKLVALMTGYGYAPTADEMTYAGMTESQKNAIMSLNAPAVSSVGRRRNTGPTGPTGPTDPDYYEQLLGAVSTAKSASSKQDWSTKQETYRESTAAINDAYQNGQISEEQRKTLLGIATPGSR